MKKFVLLSLSLLVLIIGVGLASATDINCTVDDASSHAIDHQCGVDEISCAHPGIIKNNAGAEYNSTVVPVADDNVDNANSTISIENATHETPNQKQVTPNVISENPKKLNVTVAKQVSPKDSLNGEVKKYSEIFNKKNGKTFVRSPNFKYSYIDLILEVYRNHSDINETILISTQALQNCGHDVTVSFVEDAFNQIIQGTLHTGDDQHAGFFYNYFYHALKNAHRQGPGCALFDELDKFLDVNV